jgi:hypothetical protein
MSGDLLTPLPLIVCATLEKNAATLRGAIRFTNIATGGFEVRRMREGGRIPIREKGKRSASIFSFVIEVAVFLFLSRLLFSFSFSREGTSGAGFPFSLSLSF